MKLKTIIVLSAGLILGSIQLSAMAYNVTVGSACEAANEDEAYISKTSGRLRNVSGQTQTVTCPIYNMSAFSSKKLTASIKVIDSHSSQDITCDLVITTSGTGGSYTSQSTSGSSSSVKSLSFSNVSTYYNGGAYFRCHLPNQTSIVNYFTN